MEQILSNIISNNVNFKTLDEKYAHHIVEAYIVALYFLKKAHTHKSSGVLNQIIFQVFRLSIQNRAKFLINLERVLSSLYRKYTRYEDVCNFFDKYKNTSFASGINNKHKMMRLSTLLLKRDFSQFK